MDKKGKARLGRNVAGALAAALALSTLFTLFGYGSNEEDATLKIFFTEFALALVSYGLGVLIVQLLASSPGRRSRDVFYITFLGAFINWLLTVTFKEGQNGLPAYIAEFTREHSLKAIESLVADGLGATVLAMLITLPCFAAVTYLWTAMDTRAGVASLK